MTWTEAHNELEELIRSCVKSGFVDLTESMNAQYDAHLIRTLCGEEYQCDLNIRFGPSKHWIARAHGRAPQSAFSNAISSLHRMLSTSHDDDDYTDIS